MIAIAASITFNVILAVIFRWFKYYGVQNLPAIMINYFVATLLAALLANKAPWESISNKEAWLPYSIIIGLLFIIGFSIVAATIQHYGMGLTAVFQKVSLVMTAGFAIWFFAEPAGWHKLVGIPLAILAIYLINRRSEVSQQQAIPFGILLITLPFLTFFFNGAIDTLLFYLEEQSIVESGDFHFISCLFFMAGVFGTLAFGYRVLFKGARLTKKEWIGGIVLGIPNFFSIHFFISALSSGLDGSVVVPLNNVGIILCSAILGYILFKERFSVINMFGIGLAILAIIFLSY